LGVNESMTKYVNIAEVLQTKAESKCLIKRLDTARWAFKQLKCLTFQVYSSYTIDRYIDRYIIINYMQF